MEAKTDELSVADVSKHIGVRKETIRRMIKDKRLRAHRRECGKTRVFFLVEEFNEDCQRMGARQWETGSIA